MQREMNVYRKQFQFPSVGFDRVERWLTRFHWEHFNSGLQHILSSDLCRPKQSLVAVQKANQRAYIEVEER